MHIHLRLLSARSSFFASKFLRSWRCSASSVYIARTDLPRRFLRRYALWLYGSSEYATFDPSLTAPKLLLELSDLHIAASIVGDESFANDVTHAMILHLVRRSNEIPLPELQTNAKGSTGRKLMADWVVWSMEVPDVELKKNLEEVQDADFGYAVAKAMLRKTCKEWEGDLLPPYIASPCLYHTHLQLGSVGCSVARDETKS